MTPTTRSSPPDSPTSGGETWVFFNVADAEASYPFADALFNEIVDRSGDDVLQMDAYDLVSAALAEEAGEVYDYDRAHIAAHGFPVIEREDRDTSGSATTGSTCPSSGCWIRTTSSPPWRCFWCCSSLSP